MKITPRAVKSLFRHHNSDSGKICWTLASELFKSAFLVTLMQLDRGMKSCLGEFLQGVGDSSIPSCLKNVFLHSLRSSHKFLIFKFQTQSWCICLVSWHLYLAISDLILCAIQNTCLFSPDIIYLYNFHIPINAITNCLVT